MLLLEYLHRCKSWKKQRLYYCFRYSDDSFTYRWVGKGNPFGVLNFRITLFHDGNIGWGHTVTFAHHSEIDKAKLKLIEMMEGWHKEQASRREKREARLRH